MKFADANQGIANQTLPISDQNLKKETTPPIIRFFLRRNSLIRNDSKLAKSLFLFSDHQRIDE